MATTPCPNCLSVHGTLRDHCLFEVIGATLIERGHDESTVHQMLSAASPTLVWETMARHVIDAVEDGTLSAE